MFNIFKIFKKSEVCKCNGNRGILKFDVENLQLKNGNNVEIYICTCSACNGKFGYPFEDFAEVSSSGTDDSIQTLKTYGFEL